MAMINCPECGKLMSNQAKTCPNCGCPVSKKLSKNNSKSTWVKMINIICVVFGFIFMYAVLQSAGGPSNNANAAALAWFLIVGGVLSLVAVKKMSKSLLIVSTIFYFVAFIIAYASLSIAPAYLLLQLFIAIATITNLHFMKNKIHNGGVL